MKKIVPVLFLAWVLCTQGLAQSKTGFPLKLGLKVAPNLGWMNPGTKGYAGEGIRLGGTIGFMADYYFSDNYALSTGANFQYVNGAISLRDSLLLETTQKRAMGDVNRVYNNLYIEFPLMVKMKTKQFGRISYFGQMGLGTAFRLNTTLKESFRSDAGEVQDLQYQDNEGTTLLRESVLLGLGMEYHVDESSRILIGLGYSNSLNNVLTGRNFKTNAVEKTHLNFAELNIGFIF